MDIRKLIQTLTWIGLVVVIILSIMVGEGIKASYQIELYKTLVAIASIIFAVMGAWLSLIKVEIVAGIDNAETDEEGDRYVDKARRLVSPMTASATIILVSIVFMFMYYVSKDIPIFQANIMTVRKVSFVILSALAYWQCVSLFKVMFSGVDFVLDVSRKNNRKRADRNRQHIQ